MFDHCNIGTLYETNCLYQEILSKAGGHCKGLDSGWIMHGLLLHLWNKMRPFWSEVTFMEDPTPVQYKSALIRAIFQLHRVMEFYSNWIRRPSYYCQEADEFVRGDRMSESIRNAWNDVQQGVQGRSSSWQANRRVQAVDWGKQLAEAQAWCPLRKAWGFQEEMVNQKIFWAARGREQVWGSDHNFRNLWRESIAVTTQGDGKQERKPERTDYIGFIKMTRHLRAWTRCIVVGDRFPCWLPHCGVLGAGSGASACAITWIYKD